MPAPRLVRKEHIYELWPMSLKGQGVFVYYACPHCDESLSPGIAQLYGQCPYCHQQIARVLEETKEV